MSLVSPLEAATQDDYGNCCWFFVPDSLSIVSLSVPFHSQAATHDCSFLEDCPLLLETPHRLLQRAGSSWRHPCQWLGHKIMKTQRPPLRMELTLRCIYAPHIPWGTKLKPCAVGLCMSSDAPWGLPLSCSAFLIPSPVSPGGFPWMTHLAYKAFSQELLFSHSSLYYLIIQSRKHNAKQMGVLLLVVLRKGYQQQWSWTSWDTCSS